ncbi:YqkE family protein [Halobacillus sp. ACCC02827]|uniref:YqkE family protein n=1 Tax=Bacillaceae TaxID=186817 RepID=UPI0002A51AD9|nr:MULTISPECIES: YqkE family protein [Bacillaceae]ELK44899.1 hypothetical protein D479_17059 [Halobacillus sp. BAB-2008]QHT47069.1 YqkE family protein [Bacillus sp. SB49]WJE14296.1 YqkE family protein [Halobacillus sp. ACCC02827]
MSKKKQTSGTLADQLGADVWTKLESKKAELKKQEEIREAKEKERRIAERKQREANKSFEELLNESDMDWKKFKK